MKAFIKFTFLSLFFSCLISCVLGFYYGWVDDAFIPLLLRGIITPQPICQPNHLIGISKLLIFLYHRFPGIAWYGCFLYGALFFAYLMLAYSFYTIFSHKYALRAKDLLLMSLTFSLLLHWLFFRITFTGIACLSVGAGLLMPLPKKHKYIFLLLAFLVLSLGLLIRFEVSIIIMVLLLSLFCVEAVIRRGYTTFLYKVRLSFVSLLVLVGCKFFISSTDAVNFNASPFLFETIIEDAYLIPKGVAQSSDPKEAIKWEAIVSWNTWDEQVINASYYANLLKQFQPNKDLVKKVIVSKFQLFKYFLSRYKGAQSPLNWGSYLLIFMTLLIYYLALKYVRCPDRQSFLHISLSFLIIVGLLLSLIILIKLEDRFVTPMILLLLIYLISDVLDNARGNAEQVSIPLLAILIPLLCYGSYSLYNNYLISDILKKDLEGKKTLIQELQHNFDHKLVLLDAYTPYLLDLGPFENVNLNPNAQYVIGFHYGARYFRSLHQFLPDKCGTNSTEKIVDCLANDQGNTILLYYDYNIDFLDRWLRTIYSDTLQFSAIHTDKEIYKIKNAYLWNDMKYGYYSIAP